jgi:hypothetical protein
MGVADHVFDKAAPPPLLIQAWDVERYGGNVFEMSPADLRGIRQATNYYNAIRGYTQAAGNTVPWSKANPDAWEFVAKVIERRKMRNSAEME